MNSDDIVRKNIYAKNAEALNRVLTQSLGFTGIKYDFKPLNGLCCLVSLNLEPQPPTQYPHALNTTMAGFTTIAQTNSP